MKLAEVVMGEQTSKEMRLVAIGFVPGLGKETASRSFGNVNLKDWSTYLQATRNTNQTYKTNSQNTNKDRLTLISSRTTIKCTRRRLKGIGPSSFEISFSAEPRQHIQTPRMATLNVTLSNIERHAKTGKTAPETPYKTMNSA